MILNKKRIRLFIGLVLFAACSADLNNTSIHIQGYDYAQMKEVALEKPLKEISGMAYHATAHSFVAINDEAGIIYVLDTKTFRITSKHAFGEEGDYEEIQVKANDIYVLRSDGTILKMKFDGANLSPLKTYVYAGPKAEYESFYIDEISNTVVLIPKKSKAGTNQAQTASYTVRDSDGTYADKKEHSLNWRDLKTSTVLHPSAVAVHPVTKKIYLLASIEKRLIVLNSSWHVLEEYELDRNYFQQPEGITFDSTGNLYITNEGGEESPTLIQIPILSK